MKSFLHWSRSCCAMQWTNAPENQMEVRLAYGVWAKRASQYCPSIRLEKMNNQKDEGCEKMGTMRSP